MLVAFERLRGFKSLRRRHRVVYTRKALATLCHQRLGVALVSHIGRCVEARHVAPQQRTRPFGISAVLGDVLQHLHQVLLAAQAFGVAALGLKARLVDKTLQRDFLRCLQRAIKIFGARQQQFEALRAQLVRGGV